MRILWKLCNIQKPDGGEESLVESAIQASGGVQDVGPDVGAGEQGDDMLPEGLGLREDRSGGRSAGWLGHQVLLV